MPHGQTRTIPMLPLLPPLTNFDDASRSVVSYLDEYLPLALWSITRFDGSNQIFLTVSPNPLHIEVGETRAWPNTMCSEVVLGNAPPVSSNRALVRALSRDGRWEGIGAYVSIPILHNDGSLFGTLCGADPSAGDSALEDNLALLNLLCRLLGTILDVDYQRAQSVRLAETAQLDAETDPLTGLLNRRGWNRILEAEQTRYRQVADPGAIIIVDLDGMKTINDELGHAAGDEYVQRAGKILAACAHPGAVVSRLGGDEFGIALPDTQPRAVDYLLECLERAFRNADVCCSIGRADFSMTQSLSETWDTADAEMYRHKRSKH